MALLGFLHDYFPAAVLDSSDWNDELDQILFALGYEIVNVNSFQIIINGQTDESTNPILKIDNQLTGNILETGNGTLTSIITASGQIQLGVNGKVAFIVNSNVLCPNLNADLLDGVEAASFELDLHSAQGFFKYFDPPIVGIGNESWIVPPFNGISYITKLKAKQEGVASADAVTTFDVLKNGTSIGTISIAGNVTTVQTNDIVDVQIVQNDVISFNPTVYDGTTKHTAITVGIHFKQRMNNG